MNTIPSDRFASRARRMKASEIRELLKLLERPGMRSFAGGIPDPSLFDLEAYREAYLRALGEQTQARAALQYSTTEGHPPLRAWIAEWMRARGVPCSAEHVLITHGSQQALDLVGKLFLDRDDAVLAAYPTYLGALQAFSAFEPEVKRLTLRNGVAETDAERAKLVYLVPDFDNPSGRTLGAREREAALDLAARSDAVVIEDAAYTSLRYEGEDVPPIAAIDHARAGSIEGMRTLYCGTFSKTLAPALRVGWICGPSTLIKRLTLIKQAADLHTSTINQRVAFEVARADFDAQVARARLLYRTRRDAMLDALARHAPDGVSWSRPEGGLFVWLELPPHVDGKALLERALEENLAFVPGAAFFPDGSGKNTLRLSYSLSSEREIEEGVGSLCRLVSAT